VATSSVDSASAARREIPGLHNVYRITPSLYSGSSPEGDHGFRSLQALGVHTILSVDGARPDVARARQHGMRYVHVPIGYDGIRREQALRIARAVRDLPGLVYIHCHHGKHRGPAAAAVVHLCLDERCSVDTVLAEMRRAGTDPRYTGLYAAPQTLRRPSAEELDRIPAEFPEVAPVPAFAQVMVSIDECWDRIKRTRAAGWKTPPDHADLDPAHEALQLREHYRESSRLEITRERPEDFRRWLNESEQLARQLEEVLRSRTKENEAGQAKADKLFHQCGAMCTRCHAKYRDVPRSP
jgi:protein tyrosine phosphatase (PTP) superfamily phosphohydrolase (DUF442 family)